jgi:5'-hydroxyaverantin dehydrogenase
MVTHKIFSPRLTYAHSVQFILTDVTEWNSQVSAFKTAISYSPDHSLDVVIPSAAIFSEPFLNADSGRMSLADEPVKPSIKVIDVNLSGTYYTASLAAHYFQVTSSAPGESGHGYAKCLIFMSSLLGYIAGARFSAYGATKFGVRGLWKSSRADLEALGIRSNLIAPWFIPTPMTES